MTMLSVGCSVEKEIYPPGGVSVEFLRTEYAAGLLRDLKESQFAGEARIPVSGGAEIVEVVRQMAKEAWPDGDYIAHAGRTPREISGYTCVGGMAWSGFYQQVYRKDQAE